CFGCLRWTLSWVIWLPVAWGKDRCSKVRRVDCCWSCPDPAGCPGSVRRSPVAHLTVPVPFRVSRSDDPAFPFVFRALRVAGGEPRVLVASHRASCEWSALFVRLSQLA